VRIQKYPFAAVNRLHSRHAQAQTIHAIAEARAHRKGQIVVAEQDAATVTRPQRPERSAKSQLNAAAALRIEQPDVADFLAFLHDSRGHAALVRRQREAPDVGNGAEPRQFAAGTIHPDERLSMVGRGDGQHAVLGC